MGGEVFKKRLLHGVALTIMVLKNIKKLYWLVLANKYVSNIFRMEVAVYTLYVCASPSNFLTLQ